MTHTIAPRLNRVVLALFVMTVTLITLGAGDSLRRLYSNDLADEERDDQIYREGSIYRDKGGQFKGGTTDDERAQYKPAKGEPYFVLENLAVERIMNEKTRNPGDDVIWEIEGVMTEYKHKNFLLIKSATVVN